MRWDESYRKFWILEFNSYSFIIIRGIRGRSKKLLFSLIPDLRLFFYSSFPFLCLNLTTVQYKELTYWNKRSKDVSKTFARYKTSSRNFSQALQKNTGKKFMKRNVKGIFCDKITGSLSATTSSLFLYRPRRDREILVFAWRGIIKMSHLARVTYQLFNNARQTP